MKKSWLLLPVFLLLALVLFWQLPAVLKAMPSRYVARLPEPVQAMGVREHVEVLPTASAPLSGEAITDLLQPAVAPATIVTTATAESGPPPSPTPPPTATTAGAPEVTAPAEPSATPVPSPTPSPPPTATPVPLPEQVRLQGIDHRFQEWNNCGPATLAMALTYFQVYRSQEDTAAVLKPDPEDRNVSPWEMADYVNEETELAALNRANGDLRTLRHLLSEGFPVIVEVGIDPPGDFAWMEWYGHYLLLVAYEDNSETFWVYDSWFGTSEVPQENADDRGREVGYAELDGYWEHFNRNYIVLYEPDEAETVASVIGAQMDDTVMWQQALARTQADLRQDEENAYLFFNLGTVYNALGEYERAASAYDRARQIGLPWRMLWYQFGPYEAYYEVGRYEDVVVLADVTLQDRPYFEEAFYYKGLAQLGLGEEAAARRNLQKAVEFNPHFQPAVEALEALASR